METTTKAKTEEVGQTKTLEKRQLVSFKLSTVKEKSKSTGRKKKANDSEESLPKMITARTIEYLLFYDNGDQEKKSATILDEPSPDLIEAWTNLQSILHRCIPEIESISEYVDIEMRSITQVKKAETNEAIGIQFGLKMSFDGYNSPSNPQMPTIPFNILKTPEFTTDQDKCVYRMDGEEIWTTFLDEVWKFAEGKRAQQNLFQQSK